MLLIAPSDAQQSSHSIFFIFYLQHLYTFIFLSTFSTIIITLILNFLFDCNDYCYYPVVILTIYCYFYYFLFIAKFSISIWIELKKCCLIFCQYCIQIHRSRSENCSFNSKKNILGKFLFKHHSLCIVFVFFLRCPLFISQSFDKHVIFLSEIVPVNYLHQKNIITTNLRKIGKSENVPFCRKVVVWIFTVNG